MGKYDALADWLVRAGDGPVRATFAELDGIVPGGLPTSARKRRSWWSNEREGADGIQASAWLRVARTVEAVDLNGQVVTFSAPTLRGSG